MQRSIFWIILLGIVVLSIQEEQCGNFDPEKSENWPWLVNIFGDDVMRCFGTLTGRKKVTTASRCVDPAIFPTNDWKVLLANGEEVKVEKVYMHKEYLTKVDNASDIAVLMLKNEVKVSNDVQPVCTQLRGQEEQMTDCRVVQLIPNIKDQNGANKQTLQARNTKKDACLNTTNMPGFKNTKDLLCVEIDRDESNNKQGCSRANVSPFYCIEEGSWHLSGIALSCGNKYMTGTKSKFAWFVDVCNCMDDMIEITNPGRVPKGGRSPMTSSVETKAKDVEGDAGKDSSKVRGKNEKSVKRKKTKHAKKHRKVNL